MTDQVTLSMFCNFSKLQYPWLYSECTKGDIWYRKIAEGIRCDDE